MADSVGDEVMDEMDRFEDFGARCSEHFREFLLLVKTKDGRMFWKSSDKTWAMGAATRYLNCSDETDREDEREMHRSDNNEGETA